MPFYYTTYAKNIPYKLRIIDKKYFMDLQIYWHETLKLQTPFPFVISTEAQ